MKKPNFDTQHQFYPNHNVRIGKVWGTTETESACKFCGLKYWVGVDTMPAADCPERLRAAVML